MKTILEEFSPRIQEGEIGIEIEMENNLGFPTGLRAWEAKGDGSLRGHAVEYVLRKPVKRNKVVGVLKELEKEIENYRVTWKTSDRCGIHIHINCQEMTTSQVVMFGTLYLIFEEVLIRWCGEEREGNLFCLRSLDAEAIVDVFAHAWMWGSFREFQQNDIRYAAMNVTSLHRYGSLEFRAMRTPENLIDILTWISFLLAIKDYSLRFTHPRDIVESFSREGVENILANVFGDSLKMLIFPEMHKIVMDGVRRVQDIAYAEELTGEVRIIDPYKEKKKEKLHHINPEQPVFNVEELLREAGLLSLEEEG